jgi:hypothetical protein
MTHEPPSREATIAEIVERLSERFPEMAASTVREVVAETYDEFEDARVRDFVEVLVEKQAKKRLKQLRD